MRRRQGSTPCLRARCEKVSHRRKDTPVSARENLSALLATRGKGGSIESISQASKHFSADKSLTPSDFISVEKLDSSKAITLFGGYAVSMYGIDPKDAYSMRNVFAKRGDEVIDLFSLDKADFISTIADIEGEIAIAEAEKATLHSALGLDAERYIKTACQSIDKVVDANVSPLVRHNLEQLVKTIQNKLAYSPTKVAQNA